MRPRSQGLWVGSNAEFSVDEPIANSSMFVLPSITMPASLILRVIVASYGGIQPSRIFEPAVVGRPLVTTTSFMASGTPASGPSRRPAARSRIDAASGRQGALGVDVQERLHHAVDRLDPVEMGLRDLYRRHLARARSPRPMLGRASSRPSASRSCSPRLRMRGTRNLSSSTAGAPASTACARQARPDLVGAQTLRQRDGMRRRRDVGGRDLADPGHRPEDHVQLSGEQVQLVLGHRQPGQPGQVGDLGSADRGAEESAVSSGTAWKSTAARPPRHRGVSTDVRHAAFT